MGREIRRVPPNYQHPKRQCPHWWRCESGECYQPQYDKRYVEALKAWHEELLLWLDGEHEYLKSYPEEEHTEQNYIDYAGDKPDKEYYRTYEDKEATWYQVYETVSEGTPVTPPFETQQELIDYLVNNGDFWDQIRYKEGRLEKPGYSRESAERFVLNSGWCPSMVVSNGVIKQNIESC